MHFGNFHGFIGDTIVKNMSLEKRQVLSDYQKKYILAKEKLEEYTFNNDDDNSTGIQIQLGLESEVKKCRNELAELILMLWEQSFLEIKFEY